MEVRVVDHEGCPQRRGSLQRGPSRRRMKWTSGSRPMKRRARRWSRSVSPGRQLRQREGARRAPGCRRRPATRPWRPPARASSVPTAGTGGSAAARAPSWMRRPRSGRSSAESSASATRGSVAAPPARGVSAAKVRSGPARSAAPASTNRGGPAGTVAPLAVPARGPRRRRRERACGSSSKETGSTPSSAASIRP